MTAKVRIKAGPVEFEYEGETELGVADIKDLFTHIETLFKVPFLAEGGDSHTASSQHNSEQAAPKISNQKLHINSIAKKLAAKTGPQLAEAAAAALQIYAAKSTFSRGELLEEMKGASLYYKNSMSGNLSSMLSTMVGTRFNQIGSGVYSLTAEALEDLESKLA